MSLRKGLGSTGEQLACEIRDWMGDVVCTHRLGLSRLSVDGNISSSALRSEVFDPRYCGGVRNMSDSPPMLMCLSAKLYALSMEIIESLDAKVESKNPEKSSSIRGSSTCSPRSVDGDC